MQPNLHMRIICIQLQSCENVLVFNLCKKDLKIQRKAGSGGDNGWSVQKTDAPAAACLQSTEVATV